MPVVSLEHEEDFDGWREARARWRFATCRRRSVWQVGGAERPVRRGAFARSRAAPRFSVPKAFVDLAQSAICHSDPERFSLLYALLLRLRASPRRWKTPPIPLVRKVQALAKEVRRDMHKMHAFVRFREVEDGEARATSPGSSPIIISSAPTPASSSAASPECAGRS
jgi:DNA polymerase